MIKDNVNISTPLLLLAAPADLGETTEIVETSTAGIDDSEAIAVEISIPIADGEVTAAAITTDSYFAGPIPVPAQTKTKGTEAENRITAAPNPAAPGPVEITNSANETYTIDDYCKEKCFDLEWLATTTGMKPASRQGRNDYGAYIQIPYYNEIGQYLVTRYRYKPSPGRQRFS